ncbi:MAG: NAD(P)/FAD-dependent oxidoreductase [Vicinamibacterales bacterium]
MSTHSASAYDVIVVGARAAGAAVALLLARHGVRVLIVERAERGTDTLSTHALMRGAVLLLHRWGVLPAVVAAGTPPIRETVFDYGDASVRVAITARDGVDALFAPRRFVLDRLLADAAHEAGADIAYGQRVVGLITTASGRVAGVEAIQRDGARRRITAGLVIGADGLRSSVARLTGARTYRMAAHASAAIYAYWPSERVSTVDGYRWLWGDGATAGVIPTNGGEACVFVSCPDHQFNRIRGLSTQAVYAQLLAQVAPALAREMPPSLRLQSFSGQPGFFRQSWGPGWALVGDAGYFKDPITAHGITDALKDAALLSAAVVRGGRDGDLAAYQATRDRLSSEVFDLSARIAAFEWTHTTVGALHEALSRAMSAEVKAIAAWPASLASLDAAGGDELPTTGSTTGAAAGADLVLSQQL